METMIEEYHEEGQEVPQVTCSLRGCGKTTDTQAYAVVLKRHMLTRRWYFCSLSHLRQWATPVR